MRTVFVGVAAAVASLAVTYGLNIVTGAIFLPEISAQLAIELSPGSFTRYVVEHFGKGGKIGGTVIAFTTYFAAGALLGLLFDVLRPRLRASTALRKGLVFAIVPFTVTVIFVGLVRWLEPAILVKNALAASVVSLALLNLIFGAVLGTLVDNSPVAGGSDTARALERRPLLFAAGVTVGAAVLTSFITRTMFRHLLEAVGAPGGTLPSFITSNKDFYQISMDLVSPPIDKSKWKLSVSGDVDHPFQLTYAELLSLPMIEKDVTLACISNEVGGPLISNARWQGIPFRALLDRAGVRTTSREIVLYAADAYKDSIPLQLGLSADAMLAVRMNGKQLPADHGFPARLLVPGLFGMENVKWLTGIELITGRYPGYWQQRGWAKAAHVKTMSKISIPQMDAILPLGSLIDIGGVAFSGNLGIQKVEVAIASASPLQARNEAAAWLSAELLPEGSEVTWRRWQYTWKPSRPDAYILTVRAATRTGVLQTADNAPIFPSGATGYHSIRVRVA